MRIGYAAATGSALDRRQRCLRQAGCREIISVRPGSSKAKLDQLLERLRAGDALLVPTSQDLGLSAAETERLIGDLAKRRIALLSLRVAELLESSVDTLLRWSPASGSPLEPPS